jgi:hypothetical protein
MDKIRPDRQELIVIIEKIKNKIEDTKKNEYKVYIRQRHLIYFISITHSLFKKITYQIEYTRLKRLHPELKKKLEIQYAELHHYQDMMFFMH